ncbi:MAG: ribosome maturation factor RimM [Lysobacteraceae bacterium]|nr:MAG: ribosome maturation factor RimM [Xanthomonadaceae bacterium]
MRPTEVRVGEIVGVFGVRGELKLRSHTDPPLAISRYLPWMLRLRGEVHRVDAPRVRTHGKGLLLQLEQAMDRDQAQSWVGAEIWVPRSALPPTAEGEYYWVDLEGLEVHTVDGVLLGRISHLFATAANDVIVVRGERERLIPFLQPDVVRKVDLEAGRMVVDWDPQF